MPSVRQLRSEATAALKAARKACAAAERESRTIAKTRCEYIKAAELRRAIKHCKEVTAAAESIRLAYIRARLKPSAARKRSRETQKEKKEGARRDAIAAVKQELRIPERVAEFAVRAVERKGRLPAGETRWKALRDKVGGQQVADAWRRYEREQERLAKKQIAEEHAKGDGRRRPAKEKKGPRKTKPDVQLPPGYRAVGEVDWGEAPF